LAYVGDQTGEGGGRTGLYGIGIEKGLCKWGAGLNVTEMGSTRVGKDPFFRKRQPVEKVGGENALPDVDFGVLQGR